MVTGTGLRRATRSALLALGLVLALATTSAASVIFDNGGPDLQDASNSTTNESQSFDDFALLEGSTTIRDVHWWGVYFPDSLPVSDSFVITVYADAGGLPGAVVATREVGSVDRVATGDVLFSSFDVFEFSTAVEPIALEPGTTYWLSILNDLETLTWFWASSAQTGNALERGLPDKPLIGVGDELAFNLTDDILAVAGPSTLLLLGSGLAGLGLLRWKGRRREWPPRECP